MKIPKKGRKNNLIENLEAATNLEVIEGPKIGINQVTTEDPGIEMNLEVTEDPEIEMNLEIIEDPGIEMNLEITEDPEVETNLIEIHEGREILDSVQNSVANVGPVVSGLNRKLGSTDVRVHICPLKLSKFDAIEIQISPKL
jgi:hypothetical protein